MCGEVRTQSHNERPPECGNQTVSESRWPLDDPNHAGCAHRTEIRSFTSHGRMVYRGEVTLAPDPNPFADMHDDDDEEITDGGVDAAGVREVHGVWESDERAAVAGPAAAHVALRVLPGGGEA